MLTCTAQLSWHRLPRWWAVNNVPSGANNNPKTVPGQSHAHVTESGIHHPTQPNPIAYLAATGDGEFAFRLVTGTVLTFTPANRPTAPFALQELLLDQTLWGKRGRGRKRGNILISEFGEQWMETELSVEPCNGLKDIRRSLQPDTDGNICTNWLEQIMGLIHGLVFQWLF